MLVALPDGQALSIFNSIVYNTTITMVSHAQYRISGQAFYVP